MTMRLDLYTKVVLTAAVLMLGVLALQPLPSPAAVQAETEAPSLYIEPGLTRIPGPNLGPDTMGKLAIDLRTGDAWDFQPSSRTTGKRRSRSPSLLGAWTSRR